MSECCFNCAYCSTYYAKPEDVCDKDDHEIKDCFNERCNEYKEADQ